MKLNAYFLLTAGLFSTTFSVCAQTEICIDNFSNPFRSESFVQHSNGLITGVYSAAGLEAGELAQPVPPSNDQIGEPVLFLGRTFENQNQNNLGGVLGGKRQAKFTRNSPNGNVSMNIWGGTLNSLNHIRPKRFSVAKKRSGDFLGGSPILLMTKKAKAPLREPSYYSCANCIAAAQRFF